MARRKQMGDWSASGARSERSTSRRHAVHGHEGSRLRCRTSAVYDLVLARARSQFVNRFVARVPILHTRGKMSSDVHKNSASSSETSSRSARAHRSAVGEARREPCDGVLKAKLDTLMTTSQFMHALLPLRTAGTDAAVRSLAAGSTVTSRKGEGGPPPPASWPPPHPVVPSPSQCM